MDCCASPTACVAQEALGVAARVGPALERALVAVAEGVFICLARVDLGISSVLGRLNMGSSLNLGSLLGSFF